MAEHADPEPETRDRLKVTFESRADEYHAARPDYPDELYDALVAAAGLRPRARLLEVGCGTGKATIPLAARGFEITALELGPRLAAAARANLARYDRVRVVQLPFEEWRPPAGEQFDLVYAATAWHWVDPAVGYDLAWHCLRPGGQLAVWTAQHVLPDDGDPFFLEIQDVYDEIGSSRPSDDYFPQPGSLPTDRVAIEASGLFTVTLEQEFIWARRYTAGQYIELLDTFSSHIDMAPWQRDRLYGEITRRLAARPDGTVRRHWGAVLQLAGRRDERLAG
ncbi:MAG: class I SAM-dependent methyltransferase [Streptosporangiaceae bacterium]